MPWKNPTAAAPQRRVLFPLNAKDWVKDKLTAVRTEDASAATARPTPVMEFPERPWRIHCQRHRIHHYPE